jgi:dihydroorotate dehydrogenase electron transfer subunit
MPAPPPDTRSHPGRVTDVRDTGDDGIVLRIALETPLPDLRAGRFFMVRRQDDLSPAIPRPFSTYKQLPNGELEFLIKVMGRGTQALASCLPGTEVLAVGPLGNGWPTLDGDGAPWVMVGGGIGSVPFYMGIAQALAGMDGATPADPSNITFIYGGRTKGFLYDIGHFEALGVNVIGATDDGTFGFHGNVVQALEAEWASGRLPEKVRLLTCGPDPMMEAVVHVAKERGLECHVSLETMMGCGVGICNGCAVPTEPDGPLGSWPMAKCCVDGPVFPATSIRM